MAVGTLYLFEEVVAVLGSLKRVASMVLETRRVLGKGAGYYQSELEPQRSYQTKASHRLESQPVLLFVRLVVSGSFWQDQRVRGTSARAKRSAWRE